MSTTIIPEITSDQNFYQIIKKLAEEKTHLTMLEIGSSDGLGSTQAFIEGINSRDDKHKVELFCLELGQAAFVALLENTSPHNFIKCFQESSASINELPEWNDIVYFYNQNVTRLNDYPIDTVKIWYDACINYSSKTGHTCNGIIKIKDKYNIRNFDLVLIDGSEFTGERDLFNVMGSRTIILDDCMTYKCYQAYQILSSHHAYQLVFANLEERHGYAYFRRRY